MKYGAAGSHRFGCRVDRRAVTGSKLGEFGDRAGRTDRWVTQTAPAIRVPPRSHPARRGRDLETGCCVVVGIDYLDRINLSTRRRSSTEMCLDGSAGTPSVCSSNTQREVKIMWGAGTRTACGWAGPADRPAPTDLPALPPPPVALLGSMRADTASPPNNPL